MQSTGYLILYRLADSMPLVCYHVSATFNDSAVWWLDYIFVCIVATSGSIISALNSLIQYYMNVHHCRCVALCFVNICQKGHFWAPSLASGSSMPNEDWSLQTFQIQVEHGLPGGFLQLSGSCTNRFQLALANLFIWATCPNRVGGTWQRRKVEVVESFDILYHSWWSHASKYLRSFKGRSLIQCIYLLYICLLDHPAF